MAEETLDKSIVLWQPDSRLPIPDIREWTSICLLHDEVMVVRLLPFEIEEELLRKMASGLGRTSLALFFRSLVDNKEDMTKRMLLSDIDNIPVTEQDISPRLVFNATLKMLAKEGVVRIITSSENKYLHQRKLLADETFQLKVFEVGAAVAADALCLYVFSRKYNYPIITDDNVFLSYAENDLVDNLSEVLAQSAICQLALPDVKAVHVEDLLEARRELKDELLEFRAGILKLTWLLHQQVQNKSDLEQIRQEAGTLVNTIIKGALLSLENRMKQHKKKTIRRMLYGTGRVLVEATKLFLPSGAAEKMISGGKGLLQLATEIDDTKLPEEQVATYLYKLRGKLKTEV